MFAQLNDGSPDVLEIEYQGGLADYDTRILTLSILKGVFAFGSEEPVSYVNAPQLAADRGLEVRETKTSATHDYVNLVTIRGGDHAIAGTLSGLRSEPRVVMLDDHPIEMPPAGHLLLVRNDDRIGMIALVTTALAEAQVNIADMDVGRTGTTALMVLATDQPVPTETVAVLRGTEGILDVHLVSQA
jgi:D-3-phosphoglycerate dehydrogenase